MELRTVSGPHAARKSQRSAAARTGEGPRAAGTPRFLGNRSAPVPRIPLFLGGTLEAEATRSAVTKDPPAGKIEPSRRNAHTDVSRRVGGEAGSALPAFLRASAEQRMGRDLSNARVHTDDHADAAAHALSARAFASGSDVYFARGEWAPGTPGGEGRAMHELAHVAQHERATEPTPDVQRDATNQTITSGYAEGLDDATLVYEIDLVQGMLQGDSLDDATRTSLGENLEILNAEYRHRDPGVRVEVTWREPGEIPAPRGPIPEGGSVVEKRMIVARDAQPALNLRSSPDTTTSDNIIGHLPFNTHVQVLKEFEGGWYYVVTQTGHMGYAAKAYFFEDLPEPNARLHRVESGQSAIGIAETYYGEYSDDWGQDLRFYVNVLAWSNNISVPNRTSGWRQLHFRAGQLIWIPSQPFALSLKGVVNSGSYTYNAASWLGIADFLERLGELWSDFRTAIGKSGDYLGPAIRARVEQSLVGVLHSLALLLKYAAIFLAVTTALGAIIGALFGGVGAAPGAGIGLEVGLALLEWIGLGLLAVWIGQSIGQIAVAFGKFLSSVWNARGDERQLDRAGFELADAVAILLAKLVEAIIMFGIAKGLSKGVSALRNSKLGEAIGETRVSRWLEERMRRVREGESPVPPPRFGRTVGERVQPTFRGPESRFHELPAERLPRNLPPGHSWSRTPEGEWALIREPGAEPVEVEIAVYAEGDAVSYSAGAGGRVIQHEATAQPTTQTGGPRLPEELRGTGADNPYRSPQGLYDKGHGLAHRHRTADSSVEPLNFTPQARWYNRGARNILEGEFQARGNNYREIPIYDSNPMLTANQTPIPSEFILAETKPNGTVVRAWRVPNDLTITSQARSAIDPFSIEPGELPGVVIRPGAQPGTVVLVPVAYIVDDDRPARQ